MEGKQAFIMVLALVLIPSQVMGHEVITSQVGGLECRTVTFEGGTSGTMIHPENGYLIEGSNARFPNWYTLDIAYANSPSSPAVAFTFNPWADITFDSPVSSVSFYYASPGVTMEAFDADNNLVASASGPGNKDGGWPDQWDDLGVDVGDDTISWVRVYTGSSTFIDDFTSCSKAVQSTSQAVSIGDLPGIIDGMNMPDGIKKSLISTLNNAIKSMDKGNDGAAVNQMEAFVNQVDAQAGKKISEEDAQELLALADEVMDQL